jgi:hypothetical protein
LPRGYPGAHSQRAVTGRIARRPVFRGFPRESFARARAARYKPRRA